MFRYLHSIVFVAAMILTFAVGPTLASESFNLLCTLRGPSGEEHRYAFHIEIPRFFGAASVTLIGGALPPFNLATFNLKDVRVNDTHITASFDKTMTAFPADWPDKADTKMFELNRITGDAVVTYLTGLAPRFFTYNGWFQGNGHLL